MNTEIIRAFASLSRRVAPAIVAAGIAVGMPSGLAMAQDKPAAAADETPKDLKRLNLSDAQKQTIFISVTNQNLKNEAPPNFQPVIGVVVPTNIELEEMPGTIVQLVPDAKSYRLARVTNRVVIVDPDSRRVVEVIEQPK